MRLEETDGAPITRDIAVGPGHERDGCAVCGADGASVRAEGAVPDYVQGRPSRTILRCERCDSCYAEDRTVMPGLYEAIYTHASVLPGYRRYTQFAQIVDGHPEPLAALAQLDEVYEALDRFFADRTSAATRVLELGCGLGYTTAALRRAGIQARGADVSDAAVRAATARYGAHFELVRPDESRADWTGGFDVVVATEVLEHVEDPEAFLRLAATYLTDGGTMVVTTPRRPEHCTVLWNTDAPPVHLFWFSARGLAALAKRCGFEAEFLELEPRPSTVSSLLGNDHRGEALLDASLQPLHRVPLSARVGALLRRAPGAYTLAGRLGAAAIRRRGDRSAPDAPPTSAILVGLLRLRGEQA